MSGSRWWGLMSVKSIIALIIAIVAVNIVAAVLSFLGTPQPLLLIVGIVLTVAGIASWLLWFERSTRHTLFEQATAPELLDQIRSARN